MNFISNAVEAKGETTSLKLRLHKYLHRKTPGRSLANLHASDVTKSDFCPRRHAILWKLGHKQADESMTLSQELTFSIGRSVQDQLVAWFAEMGIAVGDWECAACGKTQTFCKRPASCQCGSKKWIAHEVRFTSPITGISGGFDMLADMGEPKLRLVEIKTIKPEEWEKLVMPLAEHRQRTNLYMQLVRESTSPNKHKINTDSAVVFYVSKGGYGKKDATLAAAGAFDSFSPIKEFVIPYQPEMVATVCEKAKVYTDYRRGLVGMPCRHAGCTDVLSKQAQKCEARVACFGQLFPVGAPNPLPVEGL